MNNITELRRELAVVFTRLQEGGVEIKEADALANVAGKIISSTKVQVEYYVARGDKTRIQFLEEPAPEN